MYLFVFEVLAIPWLQIDIPRQKGAVWSLFKFASFQRQYNKLTHFY